METNKTNTGVQTQSNGSVTIMPTVVEIDHLQRFEQVFKLETELVGATYRKKSDKGAVRCGVLNMKDLKSVNPGMEKGELALLRRSMTDKLKTEAGALVNRLMSDPRYTGRTVAINAKGNVLTLAFEKVDPITVVSLTEDERLAQAKTLSLEQLRGLVAQLEAADANPATPATPPANLQTPKPAAPAPTAPKAPDTNKAFK